MVTLEWQMDLECVLYSLLITGKDSEKNNRLNKSSGCFYLSFFVAECLFSTCFVYLTHFDQFQEEHIMEVMTVIRVMQ